MGQLLLDETVASVVKVEIARDHGDPTAQFTVRNDVKITPTMRTRQRRPNIAAINIPDSADVVFNIMRQKLADMGIAAYDVQKTNLPEMAAGTTDFSATATLDVGSRSDDELRAAFEQAYTAAIQHMAAKRFRGKAGAWTDRRGGMAAEEGLGGL